MTDWWSTSPGSATENRDEPRAATDWNAEPLPPPPVAPPVAPEPEPEPESGSAKSRKRGILLGAAGAALVGVIVFNAMPDGGTMPPDHSTTSTAAQDGALPAAGGGPDIANEEASQAPQATSQAPEPKVVTLTAQESGKGTVGVIVNVTIRNDTDDSVTLLANFVKGDGRPALVGEGTLAPGARVIEPGQTTEGTVEFAADRMPQQVALVDLSGGIVAASE